MDRLDSGRSKSIWDNQSERDARWYNLASMGHGGTRRLYIVTRGNSKTSCTIPSAVRSKTTEYSVVGSSLQHTWASTFPAFGFRVNYFLRPESHLLIFIKEPVDLNLAPSTRSKLSLYIFIPSQDTCGNVQGPSVIDINLGSKFLAWSIRYLTLSSPF